MAHRIHYTQISKLSAIFSRYQSRSIKNSSDDSKDKDMNKIQTKTEEREGIK